MARQALYRKHRSKTLDDVVGQDHITKTLKNAVKSGKISHAYLFTGPRGVGKTSVARIMAHLVNGLDYDETKTYLDIIEIDAASNRRIDEIRDLRDKVNIAPVSAKYKVYIIDEVHMLTREAFNALLKTLEEPPEHVIFILATTEAHKLPDTIISRTQRYTFKPISPKDALIHLKNIANQENVSIDDEALLLIAEHANGSFRDSISMLDQLSGLGTEIGEAEVRLLLGIPDSESIARLMTLINNCDISLILTELQELELSGVTPTKIAEAISANIRTEIEKTNSVSDEQIGFLDNLSQVKSSQDPNTQLQLAILSTCATNAPITKLDPNSEPAKATPAENLVKSKTTSTKAEPTKPITSKPAIKPSSGQTNDWNSVLGEVKGVHNTLYGILRMAEARHDGRKITLAFRFPFHQKQISNQQNLARVRTAIYKVYGDDTAIECIVDENIISEELPSTPNEPSVPKNDTLSAISNIFDGAELLES